MDQLIEKTENNIKWMEANYQTVKQALEARA